MQFSLALRLCVCVWGGGAGGFEYEMVSCRIQEKYLAYFCSMIKTVTGFCSCSRCF